MWVSQEIAERIVDRIELQIPVSCFGPRQKDVSDLVTLQTEQRGELPFWKERAIDGSPKARLHDVPIVGAHSGNPRRQRRIHGQTVTPTQTAEYGLIRTKQHPLIGHESEFRLRTPAAQNPTRCPRGVVSTGWGAGPID